MIKIIVGLPGSGKSCYGAYQSKKWQSKGFNVYSNYEVDGNFYFDTEDLGHYLLESGNMIVDEAGIDISNRDFINKKNITTDKAARSFWKRHRKYGIGELLVLSQAFDFDKTVRNLAAEMWIIKRSIIPHLSILKRVKPYWDIDQDGQPCIKWQIVPFFFKLFFRLPYYKYYDSYERPDLPFKIWQQMRIDFRTPRYYRLDALGDYLSDCLQVLSQDPFPFPLISRL